MKRRLVIAIAVLTLVTGAVLAWWMNHQCHVPVGRAAIKASNSIGCFEFWFNRYQTLVSGILALVAATIAAWLVWGQLRLMEADRALRLQDIVIRRGREISDLQHLAVEIWHFGFLMSNACSSFRQSSTLSNTNDFIGSPAQEFIKSVQSWQLDLHELEVRVDQAYSKFLGGPETVESFSEASSELREVGKVVTKKVGELNILNLPNRWLGHGPPFGDKDWAIIMSAAKLFESQGEQVQELGNRISDQLGRELNRLYGRYRQLDASLDN